MYILDEELILKFDFETEGIPLAYKFKLRNVHYIFIFGHQTIYQIFKLIKVEKINLDLMNKIIGKERPKNFVDMLLQRF